MPTQAQRAYEKIGDGSAVLSIQRRYDAFYKESGPVIESPNLWRVENRLSSETFYLATSYRRHGKFRMSDCNRRTKDHILGQFKLMQGK